MESIDFLVYGFSAVVLVITIAVAFEAFVGFEAVVDFFCDHCTKKQVRRWKKRVNRRVRAAKKGNMLPLAKEIVKDKGRDTICYSCDTFTEKERTEIMNICFNLIRLKKFPKNPQEKEDKIGKLKRKFQVNGWDPEYDEVKEVCERINAAEAKKAKAKKIN